jgi:hypothetical protein
MTDQHVKKLDKALEQFALVKADMTAVLDVVKDNDIDMFRKKAGPRRPDCPSHRNSLLYEVDGVLERLEEDLEKERKKKE